MSTLLLEQILAYITIPIFTLILLFLIFLIAKFQFNLSFPGTEKTSQESNHVSLAAYVFLALLILFFVFVTYISRRRHI